MSALFQASPPVQSCVARTQSAHVCWQFLFIQPVVLPRLLCSLGAGSTCNNDKGEKSESRTYEHAQSKGCLSGSGSGCHRASKIRRVWVQGDELSPRTDGQEVGEKGSGHCRQRGVTTAAGQPLERCRYWMWTRGRVVGALTMCCLLFLVLYVRPSSVTASQHTRSPLAQTRAQTHSGVGSLSTATQPEAAGPRREPSQSLDLHFFVPGQFM